MWDELSEGRQHGARTNPLLHPELCINIPSYGAVMYFPYIDRCLTANLSPFDDCAFQWSLFKYRPTWEGIAHGRCKAACGLGSGLANFLRLSQQPLFLNQSDISPKIRSVPPRILVCKYLQVRNGALRYEQSFPHLTITELTWHFGAPVMQQKQVPSLKFPAICLTVFPRSKGRNLWRNPPCTETAEH